MIIDAQDIYKIIKRIVKIYPANIKYRHSNSRMRDEYYINVQDYKITIYKMKDKTLLVVNMSKNDEVLISDYRFCNGITEKQNIVLIAMLEDAVKNHNEYLWKALKNIC